MVTITSTCVPNFYDVLSSNGYDHYPLLVEPEGVTCGCPGFTRWHHCKHADQAASIRHIPEIEISPVPVAGSEGKEVTCPCCGAWMMAWAWPVHLRGNFCEMYLEERAALVAALPGSVASAPAAAFYITPLAA